MLIIADNDQEGVRAKLRELFGNAPIDGVDVIGVEAGQRLTNDFGQDVEHFGYVDGTSQPLFLQSDVDRDAPRHRLSGWSPAFAPRQVLVRCPGGGYGSYLVFRKLEQNLAAFARAKERLAAQLGMVGDSGLAGARIVGRYEDGQPAGLRHPAASILPVENGFVYNSDPPACPIGSHVRIVNPRTARSRATAIARRGIPYGGPVDKVAWSQPERLPSEGVGLLFMAYMADIGAQYEAIQVAANGSGQRDRDPLIGQRSTAAASYAAASPGSAPLVRLRGGGYFFVPSPAFLRQTDSGGPSGSAARRPATTQAGTGYDGPRRQDAPAANGRPW
jgi:Dyp-type peroxidase family